MRGVNTDADWGVPPMNRILVMGLPCSQGTVLTRYVLLIETMPYNERVPLFASRYECQGGVSLRSIAAVRKTDAPLRLHVKREVDGCSVINAIQLAPA